MEEDSEPIVIDIGSGTLKAGFASDDAPKVIMPMVIGKPRSPGILVGMD
jgi:actin, other eukaryote